MLQDIDSPPSSSAHHQDVSRASNALFGHVLQGPQPLTPPADPQGPTGTGQYALCMHVSFACCGLWLHTLVWSARLSCFMSTLVVHCNNWAGLPILAAVMLMRGHALSSKNGMSISWKLMCFVASTCNDLSLGSQRLWCVKTNHVTASCG